MSLYKLDYEDKPTAAGGEVLEAGDHIYIWCSPGYQHHGIVLEIQKGAVEAAENEAGLVVADTITVTSSTDQAETESTEVPPATSASQPRILIAEFTNAALTETPLWSSASHASTAVSTGVMGAFRYIYETQPSKWHKVKYQANPLECMTWRPGTCSPVTPDLVQVVLTRVQFLRTCNHFIPDYHVLASNCEAVAVWCKTGKYQSSQVRVLDYSKATVTGMGTALFSPLAGVMLGGLSVWHTMETNKQCQVTTDILNREFAVYTMGKSPLSKQWI
jgi:hypothetical protein